MHAASQTRNPHRVVPLFRVKRLKLKTVRLRPSPLQVPDVYGIGVAWRGAGGATTVGFEWDRVEYSDILRSIDSTAIKGIENLSLDDADELHLGFEYAFLRWEPVVAFRGGAWRDPAHQFSGADALADDPRPGRGGAFERAVFRGGEDANHVSLGAGLVFRSVQIDVGIDFSDFVDTFALSGIYSF